VGISLRIDASRAGDGIGVWDIRGWAFIIFLDLSICIFVIA
jgi:hypothetical protein